MKILLENVGGKRIITCWMSKVTPVYGIVISISMFVYYVIQCLPIKRKPVLSVGYLDYFHCHARFNQTICLIIKGIFSSFI